MGKYGRQTCMNFHVVPVVHYDIDTFQDSFIAEHYLIAHSHIFVKHMDDRNSNLSKDNAISMNDLFRGKTVAVFGVPAPFTGTCTTAHYPPYKTLRDDFSAKGVDEVVCYSVADPYALYNWGKSMDNDFARISFVADVDGEWAEQHDLIRDYSAASLGHRSERFSMLVEDGIVKSFNIVKDADKDAETLLSQV